MKQSENQKRSNLIFKSGFRNITSSKFQFIGLVVLFFLLGLVITSVSVVTRRVGGNLSALNEKSQLHHAVASFNDAQVVRKKIINNPNPPIINHPPCKSSDLLTSSEGPEFEIIQKVMNQLATNYRFIFNLRETRNFLIDNSKVWLKIIGFDHRQTVDKLVITGGSNFSSDPHRDRGIIFESRFAALHHLAIGDIIRVIPDGYGADLKINNREFLNAWSVAHQTGITFEAWIKNSKFKSFAWYEVRGFGTSADFAYPIISRTQPIVNKQTQGIAYVKNSNFGLIWDQNYWSYLKKNDLLLAYNQSATEVYYPLRFLNDSRYANNHSDAVRKMNKQLIHQGVSIGGINFFLKPSESDKLIFQRGDPSYFFARRIDFPWLLVGLYRVLSYLSLVFISLITMIVTFFLIHQRVTAQKGQIGLLKAMGYRKSTIFTSFLMFPIGVGLTGGLVGFLCSLLIENRLIDYFTNFLNFETGHIFIPWISLLVTLVFFFGFILLITWIAVWPLFFRSCISLIYRPNIVVWKNFSVFHRFTRRWWNRLPFLPRLKLRIGTTSLAKTGSVFLTFCVGAIILGTATFLGRSLIDADHYYFAGQNYQVASFYQSPVWNVPTSFYRTYDFTNHDWSADTDFPSLEKVVQQLVNHQMPLQYYSLKPGLLAKFTGIPYYLFQLTWKNFNLLSFKILIEKYSLGPQIANLLIGNSLWPDYYHLKQQLVKHQLYCWSDDGHPEPRFFSPTFKDRHLIFIALRSFYLKYRKGVLLSVNPKLLKHKPKDIFSDRQWKYQNDSTSDFISPSKTTPFLCNDSELTTVHPFSIKNHLLFDEDQDIIQADVKWKDWSQDKKNNLLQDLVNWFNVTFFNRFYPAFVQGVYSMAPYYVQRYFKQNKNYSISFNVVPITSRDYLGTYLNVHTPNQKRNIRILGVDQNRGQQFINLGSNLSSSFWAPPSQAKPPISMVINQTLAHIYHLKPGLITQKFEITTPIVQGNIEGTPWPTSPTLDPDNHFNFSNVLNDIGQPPHQINVKGWLSSSLLLNHIKLGQNELYNLDFYSQKTPILTAIEQHDTYLNFQQINPSFKIVGVQNNYGPPTAYINQKQANHLLHYDWTKSVLYHLFRKIWSEKNLPEKISSLKDPQQRKAIQDIEATKDFKKLKTQYAKRMFEAAFPMFNYRLSQNTQSDLVHGVTVINSFGDFSQHALDGYSDQKGDPPKTKIYPHYGANGLIDIFDRTVFKHILKKQLTVLLLVLFFICTVFISMSLIIISLASDLVIRQHSFLIQNLRIVGYSDKKILHIICDSFFWFLPLVGMIGGFCGWYIAGWWIKILGSKFQLLLPQIFHPISFFIFIIIVTILFLFSFGFSFLTLKRMSLVKTIRQAGTSF